jgi:hypothetical protein
MTSVKLKFISPGKLNIKKITNEIRKALKEEAKDIKKMYDMAVRTWEEKPKFQTNIVEGPNPSVQVFTDDPVFTYIDLGTKKRWALMSGDWKSKTTSGMIGSSRGRGRAVLVGKKAFQKRRMRARPGIKARHFTKNIMMVREPALRRRMEAAIKKGADETFER